jgi:hypothetical protein
MLSGEHPVRAMVPAVVSQPEFRPCDPADKVTVPAECSRLPVRAAPYHGQLSTTATEAKNSVEARVATKKPVGSELPICGLAGREATL